MQGFQIYNRIDICLYHEYLFPSSKFHVNKVHFLSVKQGLLDEQFDESKIYNAENLNGAISTLQEILQPRDIVLWENDLPDNYT